MEMTKDHRTQMLRLDGTHHSCNQLQEESLSIALSVTFPAHKLLISRHTHGHIQERSLSDVSSVTILQRHMFIHNGKRPFACKQCNYSFSRSNGLKFHMFSHTIEKSFACEQCDYSFKIVGSHTVTIPAKHIMTSRHKCLHIQEKSLSYVSTATFLAQLLKISKSTCSNTLEKALCTYAMQLLFQSLKRFEISHTFTHR